MDDSLPKHHCETPSLAVAVNVYRESFRQVHECLSRLATNMAHARVAVIFNGVDRPEIERIAVQNHFTVIRGENLGTNTNWRQWWLRMLAFFASSAAEVCLKIDPDTMVDAPPAFFPKSKYFGTVCGRFIQGGITGLSKHAVHGLLASQILELDAVEGALLFPMPPAVPFMDDQLLAKALVYLGIYPEDWTECRSVWREEISNNPAKHAIVHPRYYPTDPVVSRR